MAQKLMLEAKYGVKLPHSYRRFLEVMGKNSSLLFRVPSGDVSCDYDDALTGKEEYVKDFTEYWMGKEGKDLGHLPDDALIIGQSSGYYFTMIRCKDSEDSPVWGFLESGSEFKQVSKSFVEYLYDWCWSAQQALNRGEYS